MAATPDVDDVRVDGAEIFYLDVQPLAGIGQEVGDEDVGVAHQLEQHLVPAGNFEG